MPRQPHGFHLTGGQACDLDGADVLLPQLEADILLADKGFDADERVLIPWQEAGKVAVIPPKANRKVQREYDKRPLQGSSSDRKLLRQAQTLSRHRHPLRQNRSQLPRRHPLRRFCHMADLMTRPSVASNFTHSVFVEMCAESLSDAEELSDFEACYYRGTGSRNRSLAVDGFAQDSVDGSLRLVVADFNGNTDLQTLNQTQAKATFAKLLAFCEDAFSGKLQDSLDESTPAHSLAWLLYQQRKQIVRLRLYLVTDAALSARVRDWPEGTAGGIPTEFHIWDINRFHQVYESKSGRDELTVAFTEVVPGGFRALLPASRQTTIAHIFA